jgi:O-antigen ligase
MLAEYVISKAFFGFSGTVRNQLYAIWQTVRYINYIVVFFLASRVIYNPKRLTITMWVVFFGGVFVALYGLAQYYGYISAYYMADMFKEAIVWEEIATRGIYRQVLGPLSPNHAYCGTMLGTVLLFAWAMFSGRAILSKLVLLSGGAIILFAFSLTRARAPLYAFPLAIMANILFLKGRFKSVFLFSLALLLFNFAMAMVPEIRERFFLREGFVGTSGAARLRTWGLILGWFARHPVAWFTGIGPGGWKAVIARDVGFNAAHNNYIQFLVEGGVIGLAVFLIAIRMAIKHTYQVAKSPIPEISKWGQAMFTAVTYWVISALSQENFVPSIALGSFLGFCLFLLGVTCWAKQYADERALVSSEFAFLESVIPSEECVYK